MKLSELKYDEAGHEYWACARVGDDRILVARALDDFVRPSSGTRYQKGNYLIETWTRGAWENVDPLVAQAVLYHLLGVTDEHKD